MPIPEISKSRDNAGGREKRSISSFGLLALLIAVVFFGFLISQQSFRQPGELGEEVNPSPTPQEPLPTAASVEAAPRTKFPSFIGEDEKAALNPVVEGTDEQRRKWMEAVQKIAVKTNSLTLRTFESGCFGNPIVVQMQRGDSITVKNPSDQDISLGLDPQQQWTVSAGESLRITPTFEIGDNPQATEIVFGYGCSRVTSSPSGLFLVSFSD